MKFAIANFFVKNGDLEYNFNKIKELYSKAVKDKVEIVIFPRLSLTGICNELLLNIDFINKSLKYLEEIVNLTKDKTTNILIGGFYFEEEREEGGLKINSVLYDSVFFIVNGYLEDILDRKDISKNNIFSDYKYFDKSLYLSSFKYNGTEISTLILDDIYNDDNIFLIKDKSLDLLFCFDTSTVDSSKRIELISKCLYCPVIYINNTNYYNEVFFNGEIFLINNEKDFIYNSSYIKDELTIFEYNNKNIFCDKNINKIYSKFNILNKISEMENKTILLNEDNFEKNKEIIIANLHNFETKNINFCGEFKYFNDLNYEEQKIIKKILINKIYNNKIYIEI